MLIGIFTPRAEAQQIRNKQDCSKAVWGRHLGVGGEETEEGEGRQNGLRCSMYMYIFPHECIMYRKHILIKKRKIKKLLKTISLKKQRSFRTKFTAHC